MKFQDFLISCNDNETAFSVVWVEPSIKTSLPGNNPWTNIHEHESYNEPFLFTLPGLNV